jgi:uncharacterized protein
MQIAGAIICALVGIRLLQSIASAFQTQSIRSASANRSLALFDEQIAATRALRMQREDQQLHWNGYRKFRVARTVLEAEATTSLYLVPHDRKKLPAFRPGQFLTFRFQLPGDKSGEQKSVIRCYSLSDAPREDYFRVTVKRVPAPSGADCPQGCISNHINDNVKVGDILDVQAPRGDFALDPHGTSPVVLIGGGVGVTPVLSMLNAITECGSKREVWFFYGVRKGADQIMQQHLRDIADAHANVSLFVCYSDPSEVDTTDDGYQRRGHVSIDLIRDELKVTNFDFYICGPGGMMESLVPALQAWGVPKDRIHTEAFGPAAVRKPAAETTTVRGKQSKTKLTVKFSRSGKTVAWDPTADNLLNLAQSNGIAIDSGCRAGSCGTCLVAVKEGSTECCVDADCPDGSCLTCVSVPVGNITLDA